LKPPVEIEAEILPATADGVKLEKIPKADEVLKNSLTAEQKIIIEFIRLLGRFLP
jgi:hypothetical protein